MKGDIAIDLEWSLKVISGTIKSFIVRNTAYMKYEVSYNGRISCEQLFLWLYLMLSVTF